MKKLHLIGLALVAVFAFSALSVTSAFALESTWLVKAAKPAAQVAVDSSGKLLLEDTKGGIFGEAVAVECEGTDSGFVGPGPQDLLETVTVGKCTTQSGICGEPSASAVNLPWLTSIELIGAKFYDDIVTEKAEKTTVGYNVICNKIVEDTCEVALARAELTNNETGTVNAIFSGTDANQPVATCSRSKAATGLVFGTDLNLTVSGEALAVSEG
jgi:hypothetical protein